MPRADVGARIRGPVTGIVDYAYSNYRFWPLAPLTLEADGRSLRYDGALASDGALRLSWRASVAQGLEPGGLLFTGARVRAVVRPSGTEPKLKCYLQVKLPIADSQDLAAARPAAAAVMAEARADIAGALGL